MRTLRLGDTGRDVQDLQIILQLSVDGIFGPDTEAAVLVFQEAVGLYADGIVGRNTWAKLGRNRLEVKERFDNVECVGWHRVLADRYRDGYSSHSLRVDIAARYLDALREVHSHGGIITSSGSKRRPDATVGRNRSSYSFHYLGRAFDLFVGSAMSDPENDPYVVTAEGRYWRVYCRADNGINLVLNAWHHKRQRGYAVNGKFIDLTDIFGQHGFRRIPRRRGYNRDNYGASEWWHFECHEGLKRGDRFGRELCRVWDVNRLIDTSVWRNRHGVYGTDWGR